MSIIGFINLFLISFTTAILDTSFFSYFEVFDASVVATLQILLVFSLLGNSRYFLVFASFSSIFFAAFSSLPVALIVLVFFGLPALIYYFKTKFVFEERNIWLIFGAFLIGNLLFQLVLVTFYQYFPASIWLSVLAFVVLNSLLSMILYFSSKSFRAYFRLVS